MGDRAALGEVELQCKRTSWRVFNCRACQQHQCMPTSPARPTRQQPADLVGQHCIQGGIQVLPLSCRGPILRHLSSILPALVKRRAGSSQQPSSGDEMHSTAQHRPSLAPTRVPATATQQARCHCWMRMPVAAVCSSAACGGSPPEAKVGEAQVPLSPLLLEDQLRHRGHHQPAPRHATPGCSQA